jgi:hypothetical protein
VLHTLASSTSDTSCNISRYTLGFSVQAPGSVNERSRTGPLAPRADEEMQRGRLNGRISQSVGPVE